MNLWKIHLHCNQSQNKVLKSWYLFFFVYEIQFITIQSNKIEPQFSYILLFIRKLLKQKQKLFRRNSSWTIYLISRSSVPPVPHLFPLFCFLSPSDELLISPIIWFAPVATQVACAGRDAFELIVRLRATFLHFFSVFLFLLLLNSEGIIL